MIQRIQTIWLLIATALGFISLKTSFFSGHRINDAAKEMIFVNARYNILLTLATTAAAFIALIAIFMFKDRKLQLKMIVIALTLSLGTIALYFWQKQSFIPEESSITLTAIIPAAIPVFLLLAGRNIWKDEKLVKSVDRLR